MPAYPARLDAITLFVEDPQRSKSFYASVFELSPVYEDDNAVAFGFENTVVNLLRRPSAHELVAPADVGAAARGPSSS